MLYFAQFTLQIIHTAIFAQAGNNISILLSTSFFGSSSLFVSFFIIKDSSPIQHYQIQRFYFISLTVNVWFILEFCKWTVIQTGIWKLEFKRNSLWLIKRIHIRTNGSVLYSSRILPLKPVGFSRTFRSFSRAPSLFILLSGISKQMSAPFSDLIVTFVARKTSSLVYFGNVDLFVILFPISTRYLDKRFGWWTFKCRLNKNM